MTGEELKQRGIEQIVSRNAQWLETAMAYLRTFVGHQGTRHFTSADFRQWIGAYDPPHPNLWGALMNRAGQAGMIEKTGAWAKSTLKEAHSRMLPVWRVKL